MASKFVAHGGKQFAGEGSRVPRVLDIRGNAVEGFIFFQDADAQIKQPGADDTPILPDLGNSGEIYVEFLNEVPGTVGADLGVILVKEGGSMSTFKIPDPR